MLRGAGIRVNVKSRDPRGETSIPTLNGGNRWRGIQALVEAGANVNVGTPSDGTVPAGCGRAERSCGHRAVHTTHIAPVLAIRRPLTPNVKPSTH